MPTYTFGPSANVSIWRYAVIAAAFSGRSESHRSGLKSQASGPQNVRLWLMLWMLITRVCPFATTILSVMLPSGSVIGVPNGTTSSCSLCKVLY
jgi:hypothetical protein